MMLFFLEKHLINARCFFVYNKFSLALINMIEIEMVQIPAGEFTMGSNIPSESPTRQVALNGFFMSKYPVTNQLYCEVLSLPKPEKLADHPVISVSYLDAFKFIDALNILNNDVYSLPTEAQWEYACKGGLDTNYNFGNTIDYRVCNYFTGDPNTWTIGTTPVGKYASNFYGLHDMHGNVWEWCLDEWFSNYNDAPPNELPRRYPPLSKQVTWYKVVRGGSWNECASDCRSTSRKAKHHGLRSNDIGFRIVLNYNIKNKNMNMSLLNLYR